MSYEMNDLLELMIDQCASDLHIEVNQPPTLRISGSMVPVEGPKLDPEGAEAIRPVALPQGPFAQVRLFWGGNPFLSVRQGPAFPDRRNEVHPVLGRGGGSDLRMRAGNSHRKEAPGDKRHWSLSLIHISEPTRPY